MSAPNSCVLRPETATAASARPSTRPAPPAPPGAGRAEAPARPRSRLTPHPRSRAGSGGAPPPRTSRSHLRVLALTEGLSHPLPQEDAQVSVPLRLLHRPLLAELQEPPVPGGRHRCRQRRLGRDHVTYGEREGPGRAAHARGRAVPGGQAVAASGEAARPLSAVAWRAAPKRRAGVVLLRAPLPRSRRCFSVRAGRTAGPGPQAAKVAEAEA